MATLDPRGEPYEILLVDDGSDDDTVLVALAQRRLCPALRVVELAFNHGKAGALTAGAAHARGDCVVFMDPDLQDPPEAVPQVIDKLREGYDLVFTTRDEKHDSPVNRLISAIFWRFLRGFTGLDLPIGLGTMRACSRAFIDRFLQYRETNRFLEGLFVHTGLRQTVVKVPHHSRFAGVSKFNARRKVSLAITAVVSFSDVPLRWCMKVGAALLGLGCLGALGLIVARLFFTTFQLGWPSLIAAMTAGFGLNLLFLGVIGLYVGGIYREVKQRPLFSVRQVHEGSP
jgi:dolichol-phosphate mannosyltransferase